MGGQGIEYANLEDFKDIARRKIQEADLHYKTALDGIAYRDFVAPPIASHTRQRGVVTPFDEFDAPSTPVTNCMRPRVVTPFDDADAL
jgi:hypothetical protein